MRMWAEENRFPEANRPFHHLREGEREDSISISSPWINTFQPRGVQLTLSPYNRMNAYEVCNCLTCNTHKVFFSVSFILGECTVGVLNSTKRGRSCIQAYKGSPAFGVKKKHWSPASKTWNLFERQHPNLIFILSWSTAPPKKLTHLINLYWQKVPNCCSKVDDSRHGDSITQSRALAAFVSLSLKARRPSGVKPEARLFCCFKALHPLCLEKSVCVFALCCLLWEHCCRWGLLTELKLSFHSGGMEEKRFVFLFVFCQSVCVCVFLFASLLPPHTPISLPQTPHPTSTLSLPNMSSLSSSLCCFIHAVM